MKKLLLVCGFPGGGTDLTKTILNAHPNIYINGEMPFLKSLSSFGYNHTTKFTNYDDIVVFQKLLEGLDTWNNIENIHHNFSIDVSVKGSLTLEEVLQICFSKNTFEVWGNKTPQNTENMLILLNLFPKARFLIVARDVRDICLSWQNKWGKNMKWCAAKWTDRMKNAMTVTQNLSQEQYLYIKYEDLLTDTETTCRDICTFLGVSFSERMLEHHKYTLTIVDGKINYGQKIEKGNTAKWRKQISKETIRRIEEIAFNSMKALNYELEIATKEKPILFWETLSGILNDSLALLLVGNRASQQNTFRKKFESIVFEFRKRSFR